MILCWDLLCFSRVIFPGAPALLGPHFKMAMLGEKEASSPTEFRSASLSAMQRWNFLSLSHGICPLWNDFVSWDNSTWKVGSTVCVFNFFNKYLVLDFNAVVIKIPHSFTDRILRLFSAYTHQKPSYHSGSLLVIPLWASQLPFQAVPQLHRPLFLDYMFPSFSVLLLCFYSMFRCSILRKGT